MKLLLLTLMCTLFSFAQISTHKLSPQEQNTLLTKDFLSIGNIKYHVDHIFTYTDRLATHYLIFSSVVDMMDIKIIRIHKLIRYGKSLSLDWDFTERVYAHKGETSLKLLDSFILLKDYDKDDLIEPLFVIASYKKKEISRLTLAFFHKSKKYLIKHHNPHDAQKAFTWNDETLRTLDKRQQKAIKSVLLNLERKGYIQDVKLDF